MDDSIRNDVAEEYKQRNDLKKEDIKKGEEICTNYQNNLDWCDKNLP